MNDLKKNWGNQMTKEEQIVKVSCELFNKDTNCNFCIVNNHDLWFTAHIDYLDEKIINCFNSNGFKLTSVAPHAIDKKLVIMLLH